VFLTGLADDDALNLWRAFSVTGSREMMLPLFRSFDNHPLLIQALASEVARYRLAPGDFDAWRRGHPDFNPFSLPLVQVKSHVLEYALRGLNDHSRQTLHTIAAFRMPARYDTLTALLIGEGKPCASEHELDEVLTELEDRGLVGWDRRANRYDLHPIVRGVVWSTLGEDTRRGVYTSLHDHFEALPMIDDWQKVDCLEDLTPAIELYNTQIGLGRYDDAHVIFANRLEAATLYRLGASRQRVELLEMLFPEGTKELPRLSSPTRQGVALNSLAQGHLYMGQPGEAILLFRRYISIASEMKDPTNHSIGLINLSEALRITGSLYESEDTAHRSLIILREQGAHKDEGPILIQLGLTLALLRADLQSAVALDRSLRIAEKGYAYFPYDYQAMRALWFGDIKKSYDLAAKALKNSERLRFERGIIRAMRLQGEAALALNDLATAEDRLHHALIRARMVNAVEDELTALVALAELRRRQGERKGALEFLNDVWDAAERGPYPLVHANACNVLAQIERDAGNVGAAVEAAAKAYRLAWCDGPPFAYHWGLEKARGHLRELGAAEPEMPPFDESKFEPMPEVEIDPEDEFHAGKSLDA
jgi:tetratricopeptide (TPR) repeat protein